MLSIQTTNCKYNYVRKETKKNKIKKNIFMVSKKLKMQSNNLILMGTFKLRNN